MLSTTQLHGPICALHDLHSGLVDWVVVRPYALSIMFLACTWFNFVYVHLAQVHGTSDDV